MSSRTRLQQPVSKPALAALVSSCDDVVAIHGAYRDHGYSLRQIATHLGCGDITVDCRVREREPAAARERGTWKS